MQGVHYVIDKLGQALASAEREIESLQQRLAKAESQVQAHVHPAPVPTEEKPVDVSE